MLASCRRITLAEWDRRYEELRAAGLCEPPYGGPLRRHVDDGDRRLLCLRTDNSAAALRLWKGAMVFVSHDTEFVAELKPQRVLLMPDGTLDYWSDDLLDLVELA